VPISAAKVQLFADIGKKRDNFFQKYLFISELFPHISLTLLENCDLFEFVFGDFVIETTKCKRIWQEFNTSEWGHLGDGWGRKRRKMSLSVGKQGFTVSKGRVCLLLP